MKIIMHSLIFIGYMGFATALPAKTVTDFTSHPNKFFADCTVKLYSNEKEIASFRLSKYKGVWGIRIAVLDTPHALLPFFKDNGFWDSEKFKDTLDIIKIGESTHRLTDAYFLGAMKREDISSTTTAFFEIKEEYPVTQALASMKADSFEIKGFIVAEGAGPALEAFRACSYEAMDITPDKIADRDYLVELRYMFEESFDDWIASVARAEACSVTASSSSKVDATIQKAASAFFPGVLNILKRRSYAEELRGKMPTARLSGINKALNSGCIMASKLATSSFLVVEQSIDAAESLD